MKTITELLNKSTQVGNKYNIENLKEDEMTILVGWLKFMHNDITKAKRKIGNVLKHLLIYKMVGILKNLQKKLL